LEREESSAFFTAYQPLIPLWRFLCATFFYVKESGNKHRLQKQTLCRETKHKKPPLLKTYPQSAQTCGKLSQTPLFTGLFPKKPPLFLWKTLLECGKWLWTSPKKRTTFCPHFPANPVQNRNHPAKPEARSPEKAHPQKVFHKENPVDNFLRQSRRNGVSAYQSS